MIFGFESSQYNFTRLTAELIKIALF
jgi:hypothetical protein